MKRLLLFLLILVISAMVSWWMFLPLSLLYIYLVKLPLELLLAAAFLDSYFYFGSALWQKNQLLLFTIIVLLIALFFSQKLNWKRRV